LKDPNIAIKSVQAEPMVVQDSEEAVMEAIRKLEGEA
jgi:threonine synthase